MTEKEVINRLNDLIDTCNQCIEIHPYNKELFETDKKALQTALQLLEQKDTRIDDLEKALIEEQLKHTDKINKAIKYIEETYIDYEREICHEMYEGQIFELIKILEE